jgi:hypothetical protein
VPLSGGLCADPLRDMRNGSIVGLIVYTYQ